MSLVLLPEEKALIFILLVALLGGLILATRNWGGIFLFPESASSDPNFNEKKLTSNLVYLIITGAVKCPGFYRYKEEQPIEEILLQAGIVRDAGSLLVTMKPGALEGWEKEVPINERVDVNRASIEELEALPRIGPELARRIIAYRQVQPIQSLDELRQVEGIGGNLLDFLRSQLRILPDNAGFSSQDGSVHLEEGGSSPRIFNISPSLTLKSILEQTNSHYIVWELRVSGSVSISGSNLTSERKLSTPTPQNVPFHYDSEGRLNLNLATKEELEKLPGIGAVLAGRILEYRDNKGNFKTEEQLKEIKGIGDKKYLQIKDLIYVEKQGG